MPLAAGTKLGPYEIVAPLGAGGMGEVYRAHDTRLGRDVAVKVLQESLGSGSAWERFEREARAASALNHPNICAVYDVGEAEGRPYLVMELLEGQTLRDYLDRKPADPAVVIALAAQIADALEAAHAKGIIHRDIKAGNIMVTGRRHVKVLDFGLAKYAGAVAPADDTRTMQSLTAEGTVVGTPHYMAPEILQGKPADACSDLWALGVVLHEMLTGRLPFQGSTAFEISSAILREAPPALPAGVPVGLRTLVERCLNKSPEERYQTAGEVREALDTLQVSASAAAPSRRTWLWAVGAGAVAACGIVVWRWPQKSTGRHVSTGGPASPNQEANELFELAMQFQRVQNDVPRAQETLGRALALDPHFAEALRYHAFLYVISILNGYSNDTSLLYKAEEELRHAAQEAPDLPSLPSALTAVYLAQGRKELAPVAQLEQAYRQGAADADVWLGIVYYLTQRNADAKAIFRRGLEINPLMGATRMFLGDTLRIEGDTSGSIREETRVLEQAPNNISAARFLTFAYLDDHQSEKARSLLETMRPAFGNNYLWRSTWALLLAAEGKRAEALHALDDETLKFARAAFLVTLDVAEIYSLSGNTSKAIEWLETAVRNGDERVEWFRKNPRLAAVRADPRFQQILDSIEARRRQREASK